VADALRDAARGGSAPMVVGALPYDTVGAPAHLVIPEHVDRAAPLGTVLVAEAAGTSIGGVPHPVPTPAGYEAMVADALARMAAGPLEKVARTLDVIAPGAIDPVPMLRELAHRDPRGYLFAMDLPSGAAHGPRTLLGASPELLLRREGDTVTANPLAGSAARADDPDEDRARGEALLASAKDRHEHALVVREVAAGLRGLCTDLEIPEAPSLVRTATLWHLSTTIRGRVADPRTGALHLATALHPTPAVCGVPRAEAHAAIDAIEPFDRGFYTGMVGWTDVHGDGEWVVALRCGEVADDRVRLYAGAGIVPASRPADELAETAVKLRTLLDALGLDEA
jgi:isochorismate synthase